MRQLSPILALGDTSALGLIILAILVVILINGLILLGSTAEGVVEVDHCLHLVEVVGHLGQLHIEQ